MVSRSFRRHLVQVQVAGLRRTKNQAVKTWWVPSEIQRAIRTKPGPQYARTHQSLPL